MQLKDLMGTKFVCDWHINDLTRCLNDHLGEEIDLAEVYFTVKAELVLRGFYGKIIFINTEDEKKNAILKHNNSAATVKVESQPIPSMFDSMDALVAYIKSLDKDVVLNTTKSSENNLVVLQVAIMIMAKRPDVKIDFGADIKELFEKIRGPWLVKAKHSDKYYELRECAVVIRSVKDGMVDDDVCGLIPEEEYRRIKDVLPYRFGREVIKSDDEEFGGVIKKAYNQLLQVFKPPVRLKDYMEV